MKAYSDTSRDNFNWGEEPFSGKMTQVKKKALSIQRRRKKKRDMETCDERGAKGAEGEDGGDQLFQQASGRDTTDEDCQ